MIKWVLNPIVNFVARPQKPVTRSQRLLSTSERSHNKLKRPKAEKGQNSTSFSDLRPKEAEFWPLSASFSRFLTFDSNSTSE